MAEIDWAEARRYLGYKPGNPPSPQIEEILRDCGLELMNAARPKAVWKRFPLTVQKDGALELAGMEISSCDLAVHLNGCREAVLLGATLGVETDRLIRKAEIGEISRAVMLQACAASLLESWCDQWCDEIAGQVSPLLLRPRFSPGYGDFSVSHQIGMLSALEAGKRIGLSATDGMMLTPVKSVTAVVGLTDQPGSCHTRGCAACGKTDCLFRKV